MKAKKKYKSGGIFPPAIRKLRERAAKKKAEKDAPIYDGIVGETTVTAKMPEGGATLKREVNKPVGSAQRFIDPSGSGLGSTKAALSFIARTGKKANAIKSSKQVAGAIRNTKNAERPTSALMDLYKKAEKRMKTALDEYRGFAQYQGKGVYGSKQLKGKMRINKNAALREAKTQDAINDKLGFLNPSKRDEVLKVVKESKKK